jgi:NADH-quinone oxidoreductase subunit F
MRIVVGLGTCGIAAGAEHTYRTLCQRIADAKLPHEVVKTGCLGMCYREPLVEIRDGATSVHYGGVSVDKVERLVAEHVIGGRLIDEWVVLSNSGPAAESGFLARQNRIVLRNCGSIDPERIEEYLAVGGYEALRTVVAANDAEALVIAIIDSGLRGRGGAGFLTGMKWRFTRMARGDRKYIVCNADEGDPGAFMDRSVLESDPHAVLEGMAIAGFAIGASDGYVYVRAEYPKAIERLAMAIDQAEERGLLGESVCGTPFRFRIRLKVGAGAFVCGEETALIASIEGRRGMPRIRPPFPATSGLWGHPTSLNNVETFANVPWIVNHGAAAFSSLGTLNSKGTKVFAMAGKVRRGGLVEVPMGVSIREIVQDICGGI